MQWCGEHGRRVPGGLLAGILALLMAVSGCVEPASESMDDDAGQALRLHAIAVEEARWHDPSTFPHPAFGWPTRTTVPDDAPLWWQPPASIPLPGDISGIRHVAEAKALTPSSAAIALFGGLAFTTTWEVPGPTSSDATSTILDIRDPTTPKALSTFGDIPSRDVGVIAYPDGRLVAIYSTDSLMLLVWDVTDPENPEHLAVIKPPTASHNLAIVPGTPLLYNANTAGQGATPAAVAFSNGTLEGVTEIYDLSDPEEPVLVRTWDNGYGCHDISFHIDTARGLHRAYCAASEATQIWDIADPLDPRVVTTLPWPHGQSGLPAVAAVPVTFAHLAMVNADASILVLGDETGGGAAPGCDAHASTPAGSASGPFGNLWFFDIQDEENPELLSWIGPSAYFADNPPPHDGPLPAAACTAHFGSLVPTDDRELLAMGFYGAGVFLVDFTDPSSPFFLPPWNDAANVWDVWYDGGYLYTGDLSRGLDVLALN